MRSRLALLALGCLLGLGLGEAAARALRLSKTWTSYRASRELDLAHTVTPEAVGFRRWPGRSWPMPFGKTFRANAEGFRDADFPKAKPPGTTRIAFLGDSVTEGYGVESSERFSAVVARELERRAPRAYQVLTFGVVAHATADEYVVLRDRALAYGPDVIVLQVGWNDLAVNRRKLRLLDAQEGASPLAAAAPESAGADTPSGDEAARRSPKAFLQQHSALYLALAERLSLARTRRGGANPILASVLATRAQDWDATAQILERFVALARHHGAAVVLVYLPVDAEVETPDEAKSRSVDDRVQAFCAGRAGVLCVETLRSLRAHRDEPLYLDDVHLTVRGHLIVGVEIARALAQGPETKEAAPR